MGTIMEALDKKFNRSQKSMTIVEALGGKPGQTIEEAVIANEEIKPNPLPEPEAPVEEPTGEE